jgi:hypothetical protein
MTCDATFRGFAQVVPQIPAIRTLDCLRSTAACALGIEDRTVAADHLDDAPLGEPSSERVRFPAGQHIDGPVRLTVDQGVP